MYGLGSEVSPVRFPALPRLSASTKRKLAYAAGAYLFLKLVCK